MIHDAVSVTYQGSYRIELTFDDGKRGIIDFTPYLKRGGIFKRFETWPSFASSTSTKSLAP